MWDHGSLRIKVFVDTGKSPATLVMPNYVPSHSMGENPRPPPPPALKGTEPLISTNLVTDSHPQDTAHVTCFPHVGGTPPFSGLHRPWLIPCFHY